MTELRESTTGEEMTLSTSALLATVTRYVPWQQIRLFNEEAEAALV